MASAHLPRRSDRGRLRHRTLRYTGAQDEGAGGGAGSPRRVVVLAGLPAAADGAAPAPAGIRAGQRQEAAAEADDTSSENGTHEEAAAAQEAAEAQPAPAPTCRICWEEGVLASAAEADARASGSGEAGSAGSGNAHSSAAEGTGAGDSSDSSGENRGILLEGTCCCSGSLAYVHAACLLQWQRCAAAPGVCPTCGAAIRLSHATQEAASNAPLLVRVREAVVQEVELLRTAPLATLFFWWNYAVVAAGAVGALVAAQRAWLEAPATAHRLREEEELGPRLQLLAAVACAAAYRHAWMPDLLQRLGTLLPMPAPPLPLPRLGWFRRRRNPAQRQAQRQPANGQRRAQQPAAAAAPPAQQPRTMHWLPAHMLCYAVGLLLDVAGQRLLVVLAQHMGTAAAAAAAVPAATGGAAPVAASTAVKALAAAGGLVLEGARRMGLVLQVAAVQFLHPASQLVLGYRLGMSSAFNVTRELLLLPVLRLVGGTRGRGQGAELLATLLPSLLHGVYRATHLVRNPVPQVR